MRILKYITFALVVLLPACSKQELLTAEPENVPIAFSVYSGRDITKAYADVTSSNLADFQVMAYIDKYSSKTPSYYYPNYFTSEQKATKQTSGTYSGKWTTATTFFWPTSDHLNFFAYKTKYTATLSRTGSSRYATLAYNVSSNADDDLVVASALNQSKQDSQPLVFKHALAKINKVTFKAVEGDPAATASYKYDLTYFKIITKETSTFSYSDNTWGTASDQMSVFLDGFKGSDTYVFKGNESATVTNNDTPSQVALLPTETEFVIKYRVYYVTPGSTEVEVMALTEKSTKITLLQGCSYNITFQLPNDGTPIIFSATVTPWGETSIDQPISN